MERDARALLRDVCESADRIARFTAGRNGEDDLADDVLRSAVERQFVIRGEALNRWSTTSPSLAERIPELPRIVAFCNLLIHGYAVVDDAP